MVTIDEAIENARYKADTNSDCWKYCDSFIDCEECEQENEQLAEWLEELKLYRLAIKQCKESSYMVNSKEFAKHMEEWVNKGGGVNDD